VNLVTGEVHWSLSAIDPVTGDVTGDLSLGVLQPNGANGEGEGFVSYTVQGKASAPTGAIIDAQASIIFDANAPITTPAISNTIDAVAPDTHVNVISTNGKSGPDFTVNWSGADDLGGSGLASFDVFVSDNGAKFAPLVLGTTHHAAIFSGVVGHTYDFFVAGTDGAGNHEAPPLVADASVMVIAGTSFTLDAAHPVKVHGLDGKLVTVTLSGKGSGIVSLVNGAADAADLRAIVLTGTDAKSALKITTAAGGHVNVGRITTSGATDAVGAITLTGGAVLGDGFDDVAIDVAVGGAVKKLALGDVAAFTQIKIGGGLTDEIAAKTTLAFTLHDALGAGITTDFATKVGAINVHAWAFSGLLGARQSVGGLNVATGDFKADVNVDGGSAFAGMATLGPVKIKAGGLLGSTIDVEGKLGSLTVKNAIRGNIEAAEIGAISAGGLANSTVRALSGNIGTITTTSSAISSNTIEALNGTIGNLTAKLTKQVGPVSGIEANTVVAKSIGNFTASVSGAMPFARGIDFNFVRATAGNIGSIAATVTGTVLDNGRAVDGNTFLSENGSIGKVTANVTSSNANVNLAAIRETDFFAHLNIGNITAIAQATSRTAPTGRVAAMQGESSDLNFNAGGAIGSIVAKAEGATDGDLSLDLADTHRAFFTAGTSIGAISLGVKGRGANPDARAGSSASFTAGTTIGAFSVSGDAFSNQIDNILVYAGGSIASVAISAKTKSFGTATNSFFIAGQAQSIAIAKDLKKAGIGAVKLSGSLTDSRVVAVGNLGPINIGGDALGDWFVAGGDVGDDTIFLTGDDSYNAHGSIASLTIGQRFAASTVAAGIDPGLGFNFGDSDDAVGSVVSGITAQSKIGAVKIGAASVSGTSLTPKISDGRDHTDAIEAVSLTSVKIGEGGIFKNFAAPVYLDAGTDGTEDLGDVVVRKR
jgi:hypothetical protein